MILFQTDKGIYMEDLNAVIDSATYESEITHYIHKIYRNTVITAHQYKLSWAQGHQSWKRTLGSSSLSDCSHSPKDSGRAQERKTQWYRLLRPRCKKGCIDSSEPRFLYILPIYAACNFLISRFLIIFNYHHFLMFDYLPFAFVKPSLPSPPQVCLSQAGWDASSLA